jgi:hypothetical protein
VSGQVVEVRVPAGAALPLAEALAAWRVALQRPRREVSDWVRQLAASWAR